MRKVEYTKKKGFHLKEVPDPQPIKKPRAKKEKKNEELQGTPEK